ncbi:dihydroxyacetone kinase family protein [Microbacterium sp. Se5.02b]|uniref:dihydroxyacetone kinase family protein n=1 Tax=Microbacterium sp. Se5.02b TaxID=2864103 RepID=UPI001C693BDC|nr:dihydroxyacetone kinase family protein [Microbacterium sp. Se5.02b]QYM63608.1 dihydroxyacetone kinase family protein [Microbacterium sp. Se5.02b]
MSYIVNDPTDFAEESAIGFFAAHRDRVRAVEGGAVRRSGTPQDQVAVVIGGGSGHYPAFAGLVGPGLAHGAAMGNVFASPSAPQVRSVAVAAHAGAGVLLCYGNYAGDVLNFDQAQEELRAQGIPCRSVVVTDDVCSAPPAERGRRRGIAGDLVVFRAAAWAAEQGRDLDAVAELAARANDRTRSFGVAFSGCRLPGASKPLFTVPDGWMAIGMGIHGEPGIDVRPLPTARELAELLVAGLLDERPEGIEEVHDQRVALVLNGLGAVKAEELFVVYADVVRLLEGSGIRIIDPEIGEYATSFEMAGLSLTLAWLDEELEEAWRSPASTPAYRKESLPASTDVDDETPRGGAAGASEEIPPATARSRRAAVLLQEALHAIRCRIDAEADALGRLDAVAGDGDHGIGMQRGSRAADEAATLALDRGAGAGTLLARAGDAWALRGGGTSGALWGAGMRAAGESLGDDALPDAARLADALDAARAVVQERGHAVLGDKTLVDALVPFVTTLRAGAAAGRGVARCWTEAVQAAETAAQGTANLQPRRGRARPHAQKSVGSPDPGAISFAHAMAAVSAVIDKKKGRTS